MAFSVLHVITPECIMTTTIERGTKGVQYIFWASLLLHRRQNGFYCSWAGTPASFARRMPFKLGNSAAIEY